MKVKEVAQKVQQDLVKLGYEVVIAGSLRRGLDSSHDVDLVVVDPVKHGTKETKMVMGVPVDLYYTNRESYGAMLMFTTGPQGYNIGYRVKAKKSGMLLNQYGLWKDGKMIAGRTEEEIYQALGKEYKEPHLRGL